LIVLVISLGGLVACGLAVLGQYELIARGDTGAAARLYLLAMLVLGITLLVTLASGHAEPASSPLPKSAAWFWPALAESNTPFVRTLRSFISRAGWKPASILAIVAAGLGLATAVVLWRNGSDPAGGRLWAGSLVVLVVATALAPLRREAGLLNGPDNDPLSSGTPRIPLRIEIALVAGILVIAAAFRVVNLETMPGVFGDEGERGMDARAIVEGNAVPLFGSGWADVPNLYFFGVATMLRLFGDSMVGVRMLSVLSGLAAVWCVYRIGRLCWGQRAGLIAGMLMAVSSLAVQFSRLAGESTPTGALWAGGFLFLVRALRHNRLLDWAVAGVLYGLSLYFYAAGKLVFLLLALMALYGLVRRRRAFIRDAGIGGLVLLVAFSLTFLPYAVLSVKDHWQAFSGRAQQTSIFSSQNQAVTFAKYHVAYDGAWAKQPLVANVLLHPVPWARVLVGQMLKTVDVLYWQGDPTVFYHINWHNGSMLPPIWAALAILGLFYGASNAWDGRFGLLNCWFWVGMLGAALTIDTPSVQRITGAWPALMLFPAALLDRVAASFWRVQADFALRWSAIPIVALLTWFGFDSAREYFQHYASLCPYCDSTTQARYAQALGQQFKAYQLGVGDGDVFFSYGSTRFVAKGVEGEDVANPSLTFPVVDNHGKGAAFLTYATNAQYLDEIRMYYPVGDEAKVASADGVQRFTSYKVRAQVLAAMRTSRALYVAANGQSNARNEPNLGTSRTTDGIEVDGPWAPPAGLAFPLQATWSAGLLVPSYGLYTLQLDGDGVLEMDGAPVLDASKPTVPGAPPGSRRVDVVLAQGAHDVRLTARLMAAETRVGVSWSPVGDILKPIAPQFLFQGPTGGLSEELWPYAPGISLDSFPFDDGKAPIRRQSDPFIGYRDATVAFGREPFVMRWQGTLNAPIDGIYAFETSAQGATVVFIDKQLVIRGNVTGDVSKASGNVVLKAGPHSVDIRYAWQSGPGRIEWYWAPPNHTRSLVPPNVLVPLRRSWPRGAVPDPVVASSTQAIAPAIQPDAVFGTGLGLQEARGIGVDRIGRIFVGDTGNHRVLRLDNGGKLEKAWGSATLKSDPGKFALIADVAVGSDGRVATLDADNGDLQVFTPDGSLVVNLPAVAPRSSGIAMGDDGDLWVAATSQSQLMRFGPDGQRKAVLTGGQDSRGPRARLDQPVDVAIDPAGNVYVVDLRGRIVKIDPSADSIVAAWSVPLGTNRGGSHLAIWRGMIVMTDPDRGRLVLLDPTSGTLRFVGTPGTAPGQFRVPVGVAAGAGPDGKLYVLDSGNARLQVFSDLSAAR
jgi:hypothetical protein